MAPPPALRSPAVIPSRQALRHLLQHPSCGVGWAALQKRRYQIRQVVEEGERVVGVAIGDEAKEEKKGVVGPPPVADGHLIALPID